MSRSMRTALLLALLAFGAQQWAVQAHWHATAGAVSEAPADGSGLPHPDCLWCQVASHAAAAAPPAHWSGIPASVTHFFFRPPAGQVAAFVPPSSWAWYSRGPPAA